MPLMHFLLFRFNFAKKMNSNSYTMNYSDTLDYIFSQLPMYQRIGKSAYKANLNTSLALDQYFGHPHKKFKSVHVAGTNGKGSVSHSIATVLQKSGMKVGLYTSPHLRDFRERIKINGQMISEEAVVRFVEKHKEKFQSLKASFFEMTVALAFHHFAKNQVDIAIVEVGLGGRLDSTNIISPLVSVITNISKDHTHLLGTDVEKIAMEKAGIIKPETPVVVGEKQEKTETVFRTVAKERKSNLQFANDSYQVVNVETKDKSQDLKIRNLQNNDTFWVSCDLLGKYQQKNLVTTLCVCEVLRKTGLLVSDSHILEGLANVVQETGFWGRWQILGENPKIIGDTAHNSAGIKEVLEQLKSINYKNLHIVLGMVNDKNIGEILSIMPQKAKYYFTKADIPRALHQNDLQQVANAYALTGNAYSSVQKALAQAKLEAENEDLIFVGGSTFVVAEVV